MKKENATPAGTRAARVSGTEVVDPLSISPVRSAAQEKLAGAGIGIASFWKSPRNRRQAIQVSLRPYQGHPYLDARVFTTDGNGRMVPTSRGIAVGMTRLGHFAKAIGDGYRKAVQLGLITAGSS